MGERGREGGGGESRRVRRRGGGGEEWKKGEEMGGTGEGNGLFKDSTGLMDSNHISIKMFICIKKQSGSNMLVVLKLKPLHLQITLCFNSLARFLS